MTKVIEITWSAVLSPDSDAVMAKRETTLLPPWEEIASNANIVASKVLALWLRESTNWDGSADRWEEWFGSDELEATAVVILHEPAAVAGIYAVDCQRVIEANAEPLPEPDAARLRRMLKHEPGVLE